MAASRIPLVLPRVFHLYSTCVASRIPLVFHLCCLVYSTCVASCIVLCISSACAAKDTLTTAFACGLPFCLFASCFPLHVRPKTAYIQSKDSASLPAASQVYCLVYSTAFAATDSLKTAPLCLAGRPEHDLLPGRDADGGGGGARHSPGGKYGPPSNTLALIASGLGSFRRPTRSGSSGGECSPCGKHRLPSSIVALITSDCG